MRFIALLALILSTQSHAGGLVVAGTRLVHGTSNLSASVYTRLFGTIPKAATFLDVTNSSLSGTLEIAIGCTGGSQTTANYIHAGESRVIPLSLTKGDCLFVRGTAAVTTGDSAYTLYGAD